jgi:hypothetical protein
MRTCCSGLVQVLLLFAPLAGSGLCCPVLVGAGSVSVLSLLPSAHSLSPSLPRPGRYAPGQGCHRLSLSSGPWPSSQPRWCSSLGLTCSGSSALVSLQWLSGFGVSGSVVRYAAGFGARGFGWVVVKQWARCEGEGQGVKRAGGNGAGWSAVPAVVAFVCFSALVWSVVSLRSGSSHAFLVPTLWVLSSPSLLC